MAAIISTRITRLAAISPRTTATNLQADLTIGDFRLGADYMRDAANSFGLASTVTAGDDVRFWAGATFANRATAPFRLTEAGVLTAASIATAATTAAWGGISNVPANISTAGGSPTISLLNNAITLSAAGVLSGAGGGTIDLGSLTGSVTTGQLNANIVASVQGAFANLAAIKADLGSVTAGNIVVGTTNKIWLNDAADGALAIGGIVKATAPFRVSAAGSAVVESISINANGTLTNAGGGAVTAVGISAIQTSLGNAPAGIINSNITINASGTLSGAGAGSVTITGLGYTGVLNATANTMYNQALDPGGVNGDTWYDTTTTTFKIKVGGVWVLVGDITSGKVAASISGQGAFATVATISAANQATLIEAGVVNANRLVANSITASQILAGTITGTQIAATTIAAGNIVANTITANQIAAATITAAQMNVATLSAISADLGSVTAGQIVVGTTNKLWLNDAADGGLAIGGATKTAAPFRVSAVGELTVPVTAWGNCHSMTYTPTLTNVSNISASTARACQAIRIGNVVTVSGQLDITITTTLAATEIRVSLPVAANFVSTWHCGGVGVLLTNGDPFSIIASPAFDAAAIHGEPVQTGAKTLVFSFQYVIP